MAVALVVLLAAGAVLTRTGLPAGLSSAPDCTVEVAGEVRELSAAQARRLTTLAGVALRDDRSAERLAVAQRTALDGDLAGRAVDALARVPAQVRPAPDDLSLARATLGHGESRLACRRTSSPGGAQQEGADGLTPRARDVLAQVRLVFGRSSVGGFAPDGVSTGHVEGSAHYEGRAVDVFFRPVGPENRRRGWVLAQWAVAHAAELDVATVIFDRRIWTADRAADGWRTYRTPRRPGDPAVLAHLDHVHLDVHRGNG